MWPQNLLKTAIITRILNAIAAGQVEQKSAVLDMQDLTSVMFILFLNAVTAGSVITLKAMENTINGTTGAPTIGASAQVTDVGGASSNGVLVTEIYKPLSRYVFADVTITAANCAIDGIVALTWGRRNIPVAQPASVLAQTLATGV